MELYCINSITDRSKAQIMQDLYASCGLHMIFTHLGVGTARSEHLSLYGLEATDKAVVTGVASASEERQLLKAAKRRLFIDIPGNGVMLSIPLKSVAGGRTLAYLSDKKDTGGIPDMTFAHELIVAILNEGQSDFVMDAARSAGAGGGTVLHAKGTGSGRAEKFFGVTLADEKDVVYIVARSEEKAAIMKAIKENAGPGTPAGAICFSLPISSVAGLRSGE